MVDTEIELSENIYKTSTKKVSFRRIQQSGNSRYFKPKTDGRFRAWISTRIPDSVLRSFLLSNPIWQALKEYPDIDFEDDHDGKRFIVTVLREKYETN
jgi:hypothetical protein